MRRSSRLAVSLVLLTAVIACGSDGSGPGEKPRSFLMGFSAIPPSPDTTLLLQTLALSTLHSDAGLIQLSIPWTDLLSGIPADSEVRVVRLPLVNYYRGNGHKIVVALDVTNGLDRSAEDPQLVTAGRSIADTMIQRLYREYVAAVDSILHPTYLSLAAETNLIRAAADPTVYQAVVTMVNAAAAERAAAGSQTAFMVSVQVETAWGALQGGIGFQGITQDRTDFPFIEALGLSSYPYLGGFSQPDSIPLDYYSRLVQGSPLPVVVLEGGWPSIPAGPITSRPALQAAYISRHGRLLDSADAAGYFQITFTDFNLSTFSPADSAGLIPFAHLGLVDSVLGPKPALATWDSILARSYRP